MESGWRTGYCPICGSQVARAGACARCRRAGRETTPEEGTPGAKAQTAVAVAPAQTPTETTGLFGAPPIPCTEHLRQGINQLLADVFDERILLSDILRAGRFRPEEIAECCRNFLPLFLDHVVRVWLADWRCCLAADEIEAMRRVYALDGRSPARDEAQARAAGWALLELRTRTRRRRMEWIVLLVGRWLLEQDA